MEKPNDFLGDTPEGKPTFRLPKMKPLTDSPPSHPEPTPLTPPTPLQEDIARSIAQDKARAKPSRSEASQCYGDHNADITSYGHCMECGSDTRLARFGRTP